MPTLNPTIKPEVLTAFDRLTWFPYQGTEVCLANEIIELREANKNHFTDYLKKESTIQKVSTNSELLGVQKITGADNVKDIDSLLPVNSNLIKPRTSCVYLLDKTATFNYLNYGKLGSSKSSTKDDLYIIRCSETKVIKIGRSNNVKRRFKEIKGFYPFKLTLEKVYKNQGNKELKVHALLSKYRLNGEWFKKDSLSKVNIDKLLIK